LLRKDNLEVKEMADCSFCGGKVKEEIISTDFWWGNKLVAFENVPAGVCEKCGEEYFSAEVYQEMVNLAKSEEKPKREVVVPVWDFAILHA